MAARQRLPRVRISQELQLLISDICSRLDVDGLRGECGSFSLHCGTHAHVARCAGVCCDWMWTDVDGWGSEAHFVS